MRETQENPVDLTEVRDRIIEQYRRVEAHLGKASTEEDTSREEE